MVCDDYLLKFIFMLPVFEENVKHPCSTFKNSINAGTHHVDVSGEPQYMERMQLEYNDLAREKGVYIVSACGFDSIPADMGLQFFTKHFDGDVHSVETYLKSWQEGPASGARYYPFHRLNTLKTGFLLKFANLSLESTMVHGNQLCMV